ncbi:MAG: penicillin-binding protein 1C [Bacteroidota bacterium]|nr:penicillin-binding protein 1C [Bacteroidota bacterium]
MKWIDKNKYWLIGVIIFAGAFFLLPVVQFNDPTNTVLENTRGELLSARITEDGQWRFPDCDSVPNKIGQCILFYEDQYFWSHPGVNPVSLLKALKRNIKEGRIVSGGSTITMQVIRLSRRGKPRTFTQKFIEIILAIRMEFSLTKNEIIQLYASHAPFGGNVVGIDAASWRYFGRPANKLSWGEAATLAVLPNAPSLIYPGKNHNILQKKRNRLLNKLKDKGVIDQTSCNLAKSEPLPDRPVALPQITPHLLARAEKDGFGGKRCITSIDRELQENLINLVQRHYHHLKQNEVHNAAVLVLNIPEKKVIAYVGNSQATGEETGSHVDIIISSRSSGSILKPLLYTFMLDEGDILPNSLVADIPTHISGYAPLNFDRSYTGAVPAGKGLVRSLNVPAVRMLQDYGLEKFHSKLQALEFSSINNKPGHYGLTLILGGAEVTLWDLCRVYMGMANSLNNIQEYSYRYDPDEYTDPVYIVENRSFNSKKQHNQQKLLKNGIMSAASIWQCFETLTELERPTQEGLWEQFPSSKKIAWKTGTSFGFRDAWAIGLNPDYLVGVWVGNADGEGRPGLTGLNVAAPLMFDAFNMLNTSGWFIQPYDEMLELDICVKSGFRAGPDCGDIITQMVPEAGTKMEACPYHRIVHLDRQRQFRVHSDCYEVDEMVNTSWFVLPPVMEWYYKKRNPQYQSLPRFSLECREGDEHPMEMIYPKKTRQVFIPRDLDGKLSRVVFDVAHRKPGVCIYWHLDDQYLGETIAIHQMEFIAQEGWHILTLVDIDGNILEKQFEIIGR